MDTALIGSSLGLGHDIVNDKTKKAEVNQKLREGITKRRKREADREQAEYERVKTSIWRNSRSNGRFELDKACCNILNSLITWLKAR